MRLLKGRFGSEECLWNGDRMSRRRSFLAVAGACVFAAPLVAWSQQPPKRRTLGFLLSESVDRQKSRLDALLTGLRERGYVEGRNIAIQMRSADGEYQRLSALATELAGLKVDVMVAFGSKAVLAARGPAGRIPVVIPVVGDPIAIGITTSLARPDGNVTGSAILSVELFAKQIELLKELAPKALRVAVLVNPANPTSASVPMQQVMMGAGKTLQVELRQFAVRSPQSFAEVFAAIAKGRFNAMRVQSDTLFRSNAGEIARLAVQQRLPSTGASEFADAGGLVGYSANDAAMYVRGAYFIDRLLKGAKVADLPIEQASRFELVLNLRTAKTLGVSIPKSVAVRADRVIE